MKDMNIIMCSCALLMSVYCSGADGASNVVSSRDSAAELPAQQALWRAEWGGKGNITAANSQAIEKYWLEIATDPVNAQKPEDWWDDYFVYLGVERRDSKNSTQLKGIPTTLEAAIERYKKTTEKLREAAKTDTTPFKRWKMNTKCVSKKEYAEEMRKYDHSNRYELLIGDELWAYAFVPNRFSSIPEKPIHPYLLQWYSKNHTNLTRPVAWIEEQVAAYEEDRDNYPVLYVHHTNKYDQWKWAKERGEWRFSWATSDPARGYADGWKRKEIYDTERRHWLDIALAPENQFLEKEKWAAEFVGIFMSMFLTRAHEIEKTQLERIPKTLIEKMQTYITVGLPKYEEQIKFKTKGMKKLREEVINKAKELDESSIKSYDEKMEDLIPDEYRLLCGLENQKLQLDGGVLNESAIGTVTSLQKVIQELGNEIKGIRMFLEPQRMRLNIETLNKSMDSLDDLVLFDSSGLDSDALGKKIDDIESTYNMITIGIRKARKRLIEYGELCGENGYKAQWEEFKKRLEEIDDKLIKLREQEHDIIASLKEQKNGQRIQEESDRQAWEIAEQKLREEYARKEREIKERKDKEEAERKSAEEKKEQQRRYEEATEQARIRGLNQKDRDKLWMQIRQKLQNKVPFIGWSVRERAFFKEYWMKCPQDVARSVLLDTLAGANIDTENWFEYIPITNASREVLFRWKCGDIKPNDPGYNYKMQKFNEYWKQIEEQRAVLEEKDLQGAIQDL